MTNKTATILAAGAFLLSLLLGVFVFTNTPKSMFGSAGGLLAENYLPFIMNNGGFNTGKSIKTTGDLTVGTSGTAVVQLQKTVCSLIASSFTVAASSTVPMECAITGIASGDMVFAMPATTTLGTFNGWEFTAASASTTAGFATLSVYNGTGASNVIPASTASSAQLFILR